jgi:hypothetical protein
MNTEALYKKVKNAGSWALWFGIIQLALIPFAVWIQFLADATMAEKQTAAVITVVFQGVFGTLLIIYGRKAKAVIPGDMHSLSQTDKARKTLLIIIGVALAIALVTGGKAGLLAILVIATIMWANKASKELQASSDADAPTAAAAPMAAVAPIDAAPTEPPTTPPAV